MKVCEDSRWRKYQFSNETRRNLDSRLASNDGGMNKAANVRALSFKTTYTGSVRRSFLSLL